VGDFLAAFKYGDGGFLKESHGDAQLKTNSILQMELY
jgi:hypothetical protein